MVIIGFTLWVIVNIYKYKVLPQNDARITLIFLFIINTHDGYCTTICCK